MSNERFTFSTEAFKHLVQKLIDAIPYNTSQLTNDSNYATENFVTTKIEEAQLSGGGSGTGLTTEQIQQLQQAHTHSTSPHAPSNAQKNSDITKAEIEAKLTGEIATHTHPSSVSDALLTEYTGGKKQRFMTQREYDSLSSTGQLDSNTVYNITDAPAGIVIKKVTQQQYDSESHDTNTLYIIVG